MIVSEADSLQRAGGAMSRRDYLGAIRYGVQAARAADAAMRCDAQLLLALACLEIDQAEPALAYAVGAHLEASGVHDRDREAKVAAVVACISARYPILGMDGIAHFH